MILSGVQGDHEGQDNKARQREGHHEEADRDVQEEPIMDVGSKLLRRRRRLKFFFSSCFCCFFSGWFNVIVCFCFWYECHLGIVARLDKRIRVGLGLTGFSVWDAFWVVGLWRELSGSIRFGDSVRYFEKLSRLERCVACVLQAMVP